MMGIGFSNGLNTLGIIGGYFATFGFSVRTIRGMNWLNSWIKSIDSYKKECEDFNKFFWYKFLLIISLITLMIWINTIVSFKIKAKCEKIIAKREMKIIIKKLKIKMFQLWFFYTKFKLSN